MSPEVSCINPIQAEPVTVCCFTYTSANHGAVPEPVTQVDWLVSDLGERWNISARSDNRWQHSKGPPVADKEASVCDAMAQSTTT